ncbi:prepilin peptidase [Thioclava sp. FR2]|uniref:prepilin peptidase n=1 Tax=Thioclava sp. FR2 TaxID=3445780 RepID=UPI003EB71C88
MAPIVTYVHIAALAVISIGSLCIAWHDFKTLTISNRSVLLMLLVAVVVSVTRQPMAPVTDAAIGLLFFGCGFLFWVIGAMGAGDAKLYLPLGIALGPIAVMPYLLALCLFSLLFLIAVKLAARHQPTNPVFARLSQLGREKGLPYAVPMALAFVAAQIVTVSVFGT